jgi:TPR repeat protein
MTFSPKFSSKLGVSAPDDYYTKVKTLGFLIQMKALAARGDAIAQYKLAQVYPKNSSPYRTWMQASADQGLTNAMLALSQALSEHGKQADLQLAAKYLLKIFSSNDSYIKKEATALVEHNPSLNREVSRQISGKEVGRLSSIGFFARETKPGKTEQQTAQDSMSMTNVT